MMEKNQFKWVPKGMKYLGIWVSQDVDELPLLNFNPVLGKIKAYLEKWLKKKKTILSSVLEKHLFVGMNVIYVAHYRRLV